MIKLRNNAESYGVVAKCFHWVMALAVFALLAVGFIMSDMDLSPDKLRLYGIHKAVGALVLISVFARLCWRFINITPALPESLPRWQKWAAEGTHIALYLLLFGMPFSGWLMSSAAGFPVSVFGWFTLPDLIAPDKNLRDVLGEVHETLAIAIIVLVVLHVLAALKHHFVDKDNILRRMLPFVLVALLAQPLQATENKPRNWFVIGDESSLEFTATQNDAPIKGRFNLFRSNIVFSPEQPEKSNLQVQVNLSSVHLDYPQAVQAIKSPDWLDVAQFPLAAFQSTKIYHLAKNNFVAQGKLTIRNITLPVILHFTVEEYTDVRARVKGEATLSRKAFGIGGGEWTTTDIVKDEVAVEFDIVAQDHPWTPPLKE